MSSKVNASGMGAEILRLAGVLLVITAVIAAALGFVNDITKDRIAAIQAQRIAQAMQEIVTDATDFIPINLQTSDETVQAAYEAQKDGQTVGLCVQVAPAGFGGEIVSIVGVDTEGKIMGVKITSISETPGLGSKANDAAWLAQYEGLTGPLTVVKNTATGDNQIAALSAATITSSAVTRGVQSALDFAAAYQGGAN